jgi:predicted acylesterase/phospholipase RssA
MPSPARTRFFTSCVAAFQGGGCRAAALVGAVEEALSRGVNFVEFAGTSAGSIVAALMGAGATAADLNTVVSTINFSELFATAPEDLGTSVARLPRTFRALLFVLQFTRYGEYRTYFSQLGLHSSSNIEAWMDSQLRRILQLQRPVLFCDLRFPTWIVSTDVPNRNVKIWSKDLTPTDEVARAVRASCSIPGYFQPVDRRYVDGGVLSNLPTFVYARSGRKDAPLSNRVLGFTLQAQGVLSDQSSAFGLITGLVDTVVDGARDVQLRTQPDVHVISIPTGDIRATDIHKMNDATVKTLIENGRMAAKDFFEEELVRFRSTERVDPLCRDEAEMYSAIIQNIDNEVQDLLISWTDAAWIYKLFPAFLMWKAKGLKIRALLPSDPQEDSEEQYRRRLLRSMSVTVTEIPQIHSKAFIFDGDDTTRAFAVAGIAGPEQTKQAFAVKYSAPYDSLAISSLYGLISKEFAVSQETQVLPDLKVAEEAELLAVLRGVRQYGSSEVALSVQEVPLDSLWALRSHVNDYKYR